MIEEQDNPIASTPQAVTEGSVAPVAAPATAPAPKATLPRFLSSGIFIIVFIIVGMAIGVWLAMNSGNPNQQVTITPTPITSPTSTPIPQDLSAMATSSAFMALEAETSQLEANARAFVPNDQTLSPPVIDLPLGFSTN